MIAALLLLAALITLAAGLVHVWRVPTWTPRRAERLHVEHDLSHDTRRRLLASTLDRT